jgi:hypothetical protein
LRIFTCFLGAHASRVPPTALRRWHRHPIQPIWNSEVCGATPQTARRSRALPISLSVNQNNN